MAVAMAAISLKIIFAFIFFFLFCYIYNKVENSLGIKGFNPLPLRQKFLPEQG